MTEEALAKARSAIALDPADIHLRLACARLLIDLRRAHEAADELDEGLQLALRSMSAGSSAPVAEMRELGLLLDRLNEVDRLRRLLTATEEAGISRYTLGYLWASLAFRERRPEEAKRFLLEDRGAPDQLRRDRLLTRIEDALGNADAAFAAAEAMNRATPSYAEWRRLAAGYRSRIRATAEIVTPQWASRIQCANSDDGAPGPAFVVGFPRSGTTLLDTFLMGHPDTCVIEEGRMLELATGVVSQAPGLDWPAELVMRARAVYLEELARHVAPGFTGLVVDKHPLNMMRLAVLHALFPRSRVVFVQRHPCDVVLSGFLQNFDLNHAMASFLDLADAADLYDVAMTMWTRSRQAIQPAVHTVVYERLTSEPGAELQPVLQFLGLEWRDELLDHQATARNRGLITTASYDQVVQPLSRSASGRWHRYRRHLEPVLPVLLPWAARLGYGPAAHPISDSAG